MHLVLRMLFTHDYLGTENKDIRRNWIPYRKTATLL